jgi:hypothetical protein
MQRNSTDNGFVAGAFSFFSNKFHFLHLLHNGMPASANDTKESYFISHAWLWDNMIKL